MQDACSRPSVSPAPRAGDVLPPAPGRATRRVDRHTPRDGKATVGAKQGQEQSVQGRLTGSQGGKGRGYRAVLDQRCSGGAGRGQEGPGGCTPTRLPTVTGSRPHHLDVNTAQPGSHVHRNLKGLRQDSEGAPVHAPARPPLPAGVSTPWRGHTTCSSSGHSDATFSSEAESEV